MDRYIPFSNEWDTRLRLKVSGDLILIIFKLIFDADYEFQILYISFF